MTARDYAIFFLLPLEDRLDVPHQGVVQVVDSGPPSFQDLLEYDARGEEWQPSITASLRFWQVPVPVEEVFAAAKRLIDLVPEAFPFSPPPADTERPLRSEQPPTWQQTIVEVLVPVRRCEVDLLSEESDSDPRSADTYTDAFDLALQEVRNYQRAYAFATRHPVQLLSRESLPHQVVMAVREESSGEWAGPFDFWVNDNLPQTLVVAQGAVAHERVEAAAAHLAKGAPLAAYLDLRHQADLALDRRGDYRSAVILAQAAVEQLVDAILCCLLWEKRGDPAASVTLCTSTITARVAALAKRLKGAWAFNSPGPVRTWSVQLRELRNSVVHGGYEPTTAEARAARMALGGLDEHVRRQLMRRDNVRRYPRTALLTVGEPFLRKHRRWSEALDQLVADPNEPDWNRSVRLWRLHMEATRRVDAGLDVPGTGPDLVTVYFADDAGPKWYIHDSATRRVAEYVGPPPVVPESVARAVAALLSVRPPGERATLGIAGMALAPPSNAVWVPAYHVIDGELEFPPPQLVPPAGGS